MSEYLQIVQDCDNFPYHDLSHPDVYTETLKSLWYFYLPNDPEPHGFLTDSVVERMPWTAHFRLSTSPRKQVHLLKPDTPQWQTACGEAIQQLTDLARERGVFFPQLGSNRKKQQQNNNNNNNINNNTPEEQFPIVGARFDIGIERAAFSLFGIVGRGAHMTVYTRTRHEGSSSIKVWIARRSMHKAAYPGMLDQAVAGGVARGETPRDCIVREAGEEAGLAPDVVRDGAVAAGTVSWFGVSDERAGGEVGLLNPGVLFVYDLEVPDAGGVGFEPVEGDIQRFSLMGVDDILTALRKGEFKPSCAMVMLDFLIRHGIMTAENEPNYGEITSRLHRKLPFRINPAA